MCTGISVWRAGVPVDGTEGRVLQGVQTPVGPGSVDPDHSRQCLPILHSMYDCCKYLIFLFSYGLRGANMSATYMYSCYYFYFPLKNKYLKCVFG